MQVVVPIPQIGRYIPSANIATNLGVITGAVGLDGRVRIRLERVFATTFGCVNGESDSNPILSGIFLVEENKSIYDSKNAQQPISLKLKVISSKNGTIVAMIDSIANRSEAELLQKYQIISSIASLYGAIQDEDKRLKLSILGMRARYENEVQPSGYIIMVENFGASDLLLIQSKIEEFYHPFVAQFVKCIDYDRGEVVLYS